MGPGRVGGAYRAALDRRQIPVHHCRGFWYKLRRRRDFRRVLSTAALWALAVVAVWIILKQIIQ